MLVSKIQNFNFNYGYNPQNDRLRKTQSLQYGISPLKSDTFVKNTQTIGNKDISFNGTISSINTTFETRFTKLFFKKLLREGIPDAYSDITLIPNKDIDELKNLGVLNKKSSLAIKYLKVYKNNLFPVEKEMLSLLETLSKKNPDLTLQELLHLKLQSAEQSLINHQSKVLNKISLMSKTLPRNEFLEVRKLLQYSYNKIFTPDPLPEERFGRKEFIGMLKRIPITDQKTKQKILNTAYKLPQSSDSVHAFIVKYSQPYKVEHNANGEIIRIPRDSEEIGLRLLMPSVATDDHIHPQKAFREEELARKLGDKSAENLSKLRVSILTSKKMNELKSDTPIDDFIETQEINIPEHIQLQINKLIDITDKWYNNGRYEDANTLADYIFVLQKKFELRSSKIKIDLGNFEEKVPTIQEKAQIARENRLLKKETKNTKRMSNANNNHREHYEDKNGHILENRKVLKHSSRFNQ